MRFWVYANYHSCCFHIGARSGVLNMFGFNILCVVYARAKIIQLYINKLGSTPIVDKKLIILFFFSFQKSSLPFPNSILSRLIPLCRVFQNNKKCYYMFKRYILFLCLKMKKLMFADLKISKFFSARTLSNFNINIMTI